MILESRPVGEPQFPGWWNGESNACLMELFEGSPRPPDRTVYQGRRDAGHSCGLGRWARLEGPSGLAGALWQSFFTLVEPGSFTLSCTPVSFFYSFFFLLFETESC